MHLRASTICSLALIVSVPAVARSQQAGDLRSETRRQEAAVAPAGGDALVDVNKIDPESLSHNRGPPAEGAGAEDRRPADRRGVGPGAARRRASSSASRAWERRRRSRPSSGFSTTTARSTSASGPSTRDPKRHPRQRAEARFRPDEGRPDQDRHRHVPRPAQRVLLQHQPARRLEGRAVHRQRARPINNDWNAVWECKTSSGRQGLVCRDRASRSASCGSRRAAGDTDVGPERRPHRSSARTRNRTGCRIPARVGHDGFARMSQRGHAARVCATCARRAGSSSCPSSRRRSAATTNDSRSTTNYETVRLRRSGRPDAAR